MIHIGGSNTVATSIRRPSPRDLRNSPMTGATIPRDFEFSIPTVEETKVPYAVFACLCASTPQGAQQELIHAVVAMERWNPRWGCPDIAQQTSLAFGVDLDKEVVRPILSAHYRPESDAAGPSWLTLSATPKTIGGVVTCSGANQQG